MKYIYIKFFLKIFLLINCIKVTAEPTMHVFGDSHASYCFTQSIPTMPFEETLLNYKSDNALKNIRCKIHYLGAITMHRVGRDKLNFLDWRKYDIKNNDIVIYVFGEIDIRCHIGKQRDLLKRDLTEVMDTLMYKYMESILENKKNFPHTKIIVFTPPPPGNSYNPSFPKYGAIEDRIHITNYFCKLLKQRCYDNQIYCFDLYDLLKDPSGRISFMYTVDDCHINHKLNYMVKEKLLISIKNLIKE